MLGLRNILILPPSQSPVDFSDNNNNNNKKKKETNINVEEKVCRDCGNRAKKECLFQRCRTCCQNRGYQCVTHVKSTWVPSSSSTSSYYSDKNKKLKIDSFSDKSNVLIIPTITTTRQETRFKESLPGKIEAPAVFKRTRVTAINNDNEEVEICYQATVTISGHVFKGFLHYYGVDHKQ